MKVNNELRRTCNTKRAHKIKNLIVNSLAILEILMWSMQCCGHNERWGY